MNITELGKISKKHKNCSVGEVLKMLIVRLPKRGVFGMSLSFIP